MDPLGESKYYYGIYVGPEVPVQEPSEGARVGFNSHGMDYRTFRWIILWDLPRKLGSYDIRTWPFGLLTAVCLGSL